MTNDGTQDPGPPPVLADPLAGLVTGDRYEAEPLRVRVVEPPKPDISAVREAMAGMLDDDSELNLDAMVPWPDSSADRETERPGPPAGEIPAQAPPPAAEPAPTPPVGIPVAKVPVTRVPTQVQVTRVTPPAGIPAQRSGPPRAIMPARVLPAAGLAERTRRIRVPRGLARRRLKPVPGPRDRSSAAGVALIMLLLLVIAVIAIVFVASFIDTISSIFG
ncbi:hypothetical protein [Actinophytocola sp.]|uniref:hypothetical protein n=1 Tax=Actinophytocola sp. TaxID=1872138 RepID=UPI002ED9582F